MKLNKTIFSEYDIRGIVRKDIDEQFSYIFGRAFSTFLNQKGTKDVIIGFDARESSPGFYESCIRGLVLGGCNVTKVGMITSPMMYWARKYYKIDGGLVITASHNPPEFNGFKPASGSGALFGPSIQELMRSMINEDF